MFVEALPSGRYRAGFRAAGRKFTRAFDYAYEAQTWAEANEARAKLSAIAGIEFVLDETPAAEVPGATGPTIAAYGRTWVADRRGHLTPNTVAGYQTHLRSIGRDEIAALRVDEIALGDVNQWVTRQVEAGVGRPTVNARLKVLRMLLRYAVLNRIPGAVDATEGVRFLDTDLRPDRVLTWAEDEALLAAARTPQERAMVLAGLDAGLRWEEALGLGTDCLDGFGNLVVRQVVDRQNRRIRRSTKSGKDRVVPLTDRLDAALTPLIAKAEAEGRFLVFGVVGDEGERPVDYWNWRRDVWRPICHVAKVNRRTPDGFVRLRFHDLRHTFGTRLAQANVPSREIMELMGHADEKTTQRYTHAGNAARRASLLRGALRPDDLDGNVVEMGRKSA
jgi:integrase